MKVFDVPPPPSFESFLWLWWFLIVLIGEFVGWYVGVFVLRYELRKRGILIKFQVIGNVVFWSMLVSFLIGVGLILITGGYFK